MSVVFAALVMYDAQVQSLNCLQFCCHPPLFSLQPTLQISELLAEAFNFCQMIFPANQFFNNANTTWLTSWQCAGGFLAI
jgi:hypothetical protein